MITIDINLGNTRSVLAAIADINRLAVKAAAESYTDDIKDYIQAGHAFKKGTGQLEQSINWRSTGDSSAEVFANAKYAPYVEFGTRPHVIAPKDGRKALKIPFAGGGFILRRAVNHPGSKPYPYFFNEHSKRVGNMNTAVMSVIASRMAGAHG